MKIIGHVDYYDEARSVLIRISSDGARLGEVGLHFAGQAYSEVGVLARQSQCLSLNYNASFNVSTQKYVYLQTPRYQSVRQLMPAWGSELTIDLLFRGQERNYSLFSPLRLLHSP